MYLHSLSSLLISNTIVDNNIVIDILVDFPKAVSYEIGSLIIKTLDSKINSGNVSGSGNDNGNIDAVTDKHITYYIQSIGHLLSHPIDNHETHTLALNIYTSWIFKLNRPKCLNDPIYLKQMILHMTQLFEYSKVYIDKQIILCKRVVNIYSMLGLNNSLALDYDTWKLLLIIIIGLSKFLYSDNITLLSNELSCEFMKLLFDVYLRSSILEDDLWDLLYLNSHYLLHQFWFFRHWSTIVQGLSRRLTKTLFNTHQNNSVEHKFNCQIIWANGTITTANISDKNVVLYWHRMIKLVANQLSILQNSDVIVAAIEGIAGIVDIFIGNQCKVEDLYYLFGQFGPWLLSMVDCDISDKPKALAAGLLCRIIYYRGFEVKFSSSNDLATKNEDGLGDHLNDKFTLETLVSWFFQSMNRILGGQPSNIMLTSIFCNSTNLFHCYKVKPYSLLSVYMPHIRTILYDSAAPAILRRSAVIILSSLLAFHSHYFSNEDFSLKSEIDMLAVIPISKKLIHHLISIPNLLINCLLIERDNYNIELLMWSVCVHVVHEIDDASFFQVVCTSLWQKLHNGIVLWGHQNCVSAFKTLAYLAKFSARFEISATATHIKNCCESFQIYIKETMSLLETLTTKSRYGINGIFGSHQPENSAASQLSSSNAGKILAEALACLQCLESWSHCFELLDIEAKKIVVQTVCAASSCNSDDYLFTLFDNIRHVARSILYKILDGVKMGSSYPTLKITDENTLYSFLLIEYNLVRSCLDTILDDPKSCRHYFLSENTLLTMLEFNVEGKNVNVIISRDIYGMRAWHISQNINFPPDVKADYNEIKLIFENWNNSDEKLEELKSCDLLNKTMHDKSNASNHFNNFGSVHLLKSWKDSLNRKSIASIEKWKSFSLNKSDKPQIALLNLPKQLPDSESELHASASKLDTYCLNPKSIYTSDIQHHDLRLFSNNILMLRLKALNNRKKFEFHPLSDPSLNNLIRELDAINYKEIVNISVVYQTHNSCKIIEKSCINNVSPRFEKFLLSMGTYIPLSKCKFSKNSTIPSFIQNPNIVESNNWALYYSTHTRELYFHVSSLIGQYASSDDCQKLLSSNIVKVIFCEFSSNYDLNNLALFENMENKFPSLYIVIQPIEEGLYSVETISLDLNKFNFRSNSQLKIKKFKDIQSISTPAHKNRGAIIHGEKYMPSLPDYYISDNDKDKGKIDPASLYGEFYTGDCQPLIGPLTSNMIVSGEKLGQLVRDTALMATRRIEDLVGIRERSCSQRANILNKIRKEVDETTYAKVLSSWFQ